ncbi:MAG: HAD family hydrolase [Candidatus Omnitrophota bacterium]|jgi:phosphoglycolate phosphatase-like HAD superfamily hydrolase
MNRPNAVDCIIFDIDNVLVDTRQSYLEAIRWTVDLYLTCGKVPHFVSAKKSRQPMILSTQDVEAFKLLGGFNDDWDCCYGLLIYLLSLPTRRHTVEELKAAMDINAFATRVTKRPLKVQGIVRMLGRPGSVTIEKIARIFQEVYLGREIFQIAEKKRPLYWKKRGLIRREKPIFRKSVIERLRQAGFKLGIATGRSRFEAIFALRRFGIQDAFEAITTMDEVKKAEKDLRQSLRKPHPFSLLETAKKMGADKKFLYVGDLPDDMLAANQAKSTIAIRSVAYAGHAADSQNALRELRSTRPDHFLARPSDLMLIAMGRKTPSAGK